MRSEKVSCSLATTGSPRVPLKNLGTRQQVEVDMKRMNVVGKAACTWSICARCPASHCCTLETFFDLERESYFSELGCSVMQLPMVDSCSVDKPNSLWPVLVCSQHDVKLKSPCMPQATRRSTRADAHGHRRTTTCAR
jgi:hypothetical protein